MRGGDFRKTTCQIGRGKRRCDSAAVPKQSDIFVTVRDAAQPFDKPIAVQTLRKRFDGVQHIKIVTGLNCAARAV